MPFSSRTSPEAADCGAGALEESPSTGAMSELEAAAEATSELERSCGSKVASEEEEPVRAGSCALVGEDSSSEQAASMAVMHRGSKNLIFIINLFFNKDTSWPPRNH